MDSKLEKVIASKGMAKIDTHIHLAGTGCRNSGCWMHPKLRKRYTIKLLQMIHRISNADLDNRIDEEWALRIHNLINESSIDYGVVLGFAGAANSVGEPDENKSQLVIPPEWVFSLCQQYENFLPGPSINPHFKNALEQLDYCIEKKACLIKWLPSAQLINPTDINLKPFYMRLAKHKIPLLIHCGGEKTFASLDPSLNQVSHLVSPLEEGVTVICAHSATKVLGSDEPDQIPQLKQLLETYPHLWVDNSGICNPSRFYHLPSLAKDPQIESRTLYGSDWPVPANAFYYIKEMGWKKVLSYERTKNWISRDASIKEFFGYTPESFTRAHKVLANLDYWIK